MKSHRIAGCFFVVLCLFAMPAAACEHLVSVGAGPDQVVCVGSTVNINVSFVYCDYYCSNFSYSWSAPGGSPSSGTGSSFSCTYSSTGAKTITVSAACAGGSNQASVKVTVVQMVSLQSNKDIAGVGEDVMFTVVMNPTNHYNNIGWSGGGSPASQTGNQTFTTSWSTPGTKTVTVSYGGCSISKKVEVIDGLTVMPGKAYVGVGSTKSFAAWTCENGVATDVTSSSTFTTSNISFNGSVLTTSSVSPSEGADWVKATYDGETTDSSHDCDLTVIEVTTAAIDRIPPSKTESVAITISPSITGGSIELEVIATAGYGSATVSPKSIASSGTVTVTGGVQSSQKDNLELQVKVDGCVCATEAFTVCAHPINFHQKSGFSCTDPSSCNGRLYFSYDWDSDSGNKSHLYLCSWREYVEYPGDNPYAWPSPPWSEDSPNPTTAGGHTMAGGTISDTHVTGEFQAPYCAADFFATQRYEYRCRICMEADQYEVLLYIGSINREVVEESNSPSGYLYRITKSGAEARTYLP